MLIGEKIGPFEIEKELGSGAMGTVYRARYAKTGQRVALKVIAFGLVGNETALARFEREGEILKQLRHPNIVRLFATGRYRNTPFFAMEYIDGESLDRIQTRRDRFSWEEVVQMGTQLCDALQHAHEKGIIHRDLKPSNLMLLKDGQVKLTDFGIAKDTDVTALTAANSTIGTAAYMSPEQCKGERNLTHKSDLYSLGVVFYELLTGQKPFNAESAVDMFMLHVKGKVERPIRLVPEIPPWLDTLVCQLLEKKPEHRPFDAAMVKSVLVDIQEKAEAQQSVGADLAAARLVDRSTKLRSGKRTLEDREAARAIRAGAKKKKLRKKGTPFFRQVWFQAIAILLFLSGMSYLVYAMTRPDSPEVLLERITSLESTVDLADYDARRRLQGAIQYYLDVYGNRDDSATRQVRALREKIAVADFELAMKNRVNVGLTKPEEEYDPEAYAWMLAAFAAEAEGDLNTAFEQYNKIKEKYPHGGTDAAKNPWAGFARKRAQQINRVPGLLGKLEKQIRHRLAFEEFVTDDDPVERLVDRALKLSRLREPYDILFDPVRARQTWAKVMEATQDDPARHETYLLAAKQRRSLAADIPESESQNQREKRLERLDRILQNAARLGLSTNLADQLVARNYCRLIRDLYSNDPVPEVVARAVEAKRLLAKLPKPPEHQ